LPNKAGTGETDSDGDLKNINEDFVFGWEAIQLNHAEAMLG